MHSVVVEGEASEHEPFPQDACVHHLFEKQVRRTPNAIAVECGGSRMTYAELDARAEMLARRLSGYGAGPDVVIGLCINRSIDMVAGVLGILKSGAAYLPLAPEYPTERLDYMLRDSGAVALVIEEGLAPRFENAQIPVIRLGEDSAAAVPARAAALTLQRSLAYVIYTSGSTGKPKGVAVEHRSLVNVLHSMAKQMGITDRETIYSIGSFTFDVTLPDWSWALLYGGKVVLAESEAVRNPGLLERDIRAKAPTHIQATPGAWEMLLSEGIEWDHEVRVVSTGEHMNNTLRDELRSRSRKVWNLYGPTETTVWSLATDVWNDRNPDSIGRPISNTQLWILGEDFKAVSQGEPGELFIGGEGLARGYLNNEALTNERFLKLEILGGSRVYRTGDLVRMRADGTYEYLGRIDHQVKLRGFRIELGEIESNLRAHGQVASCTCILREDVPGEKRIVAYAALKPGSDTGPGELKQFLRTNLPDYMIPSAVILMDRLPLNANGKIDRGALPLPESVDSTERETNLAPKTAAEVAIAEIWRSILRVDKIGVGDNFLELGGHSILVVRMLGLLKKKLGWDVPYEAFIQSPTIADLCKSRHGFDGSTPLLVFRERPATDVLVCTHGYGFGNGVLEYAPTVTYLPKFLSVWGLQGQGWAGGKVERIPLPQICHRYATLLAHTFSGRRVSLLGYCVGGVVAVEVARQMAAIGFRPHRTLLIDATAPEARRDYLAEYTRQRHQAQAAERRQSFIPYFTHRVAEYLRFQRTYKSYQMRLRLSQWLVRWNRPVPVPWRNDYHGLIQGPSLDYHEAGFYDGRLDLIRSSDPEEQALEPGWEPHASEVVTLGTLNCRHSDRLNENFAKEAAALIAQRIFE